MLEHEIKKLVEEFLGATGFHVEKMELTLDISDGSYTAHLSSNDSRKIIGRGGEGLQDLNHLLRRVVEKKSGDAAPRITVDVNGYLRERIERLQTMAHMMAERARFFKSSVELEPMNAYERRVIHDFVSRHADLISESSGTGKNRRVVISFKKD